MPKSSKARRRSQSRNTPPNQEIEGTSAEQPALAKNAPGESQPRPRMREMSPQARLISLVVGDILCFLIFVSLGSNTHGEGVNVLHSLWLSLPFLAAWFVVSPFIGAYKADISTRPAKMLRRTLLAWVIAWPVAMALRWFMVERLAPVPLESFVSFSIVVLLANLIILVVWRWPFALNNSLRQRGA